MVSTAARRLGLGTLGLALALAVGCGTTPGLTKANFDQIKVSESSKEDVDKLLGSQGTKLTGADAEQFMPKMPDMNAELDKLTKEMEEKTKGLNEDEAKKIREEYQKTIDQMKGKMPDLKMPPGGGFPGGGFPGGGNPFANAEVYRWGDASKNVTCFIQGGKVTRKMAVGL